MTYTPAFLSFWDAYRCPRRVKKLAAYQAWSREGCEENAPEVLSGLERFKLTAQWREGFMPEPERWIKQRRWEDEPVEADAPPEPEAGTWDVTGPPK